MGRKKKPASEIILSGQADYRPQRFKNDNLGLGIPVEGVPVCPKGTSKQGKAMWNTTVPSLIEMGVISQTDLSSMLEMLHVYEELQRSIRAKEQYCHDHPDWYNDISTVNHYQKLNKIYNQCETQWLQISTRFGLTPSDRRNLPQGYEQKEEELDPLAEIGL